MRSRNLTISAVLLLTAVTPSIAQSRRAPAHTVARPATTPQRPVSSAPKLAPDFIVIAPPPELTFEPPRPRIDLWPVRPPIVAQPRAISWSPDDRSGPRLGAAYILGGSVTAERNGQTMSPMTSLFGWQLEHQFQTGVENGIVPVTEMVGLVGGLEQNRFLPSASLLIGLRQPNGWEAAVGPTLTGAGVQLAFAAGITRRYGNLNIPVNLAIAPGRRGAAISLTTGFNSVRGL